MDNPNSWKEANEYTQQIIKEFPEYEMDSERLLQESITKFYPSIKIEVERIVKQWNLIVREMIRNETGLKLQHNEQYVQIPVRVQNGFPTAIKDIINKFQHPELWNLFLGRHRIQDTIPGFQIVNENYKHLNKVIANYPNYEDLAHMEKFMSKLFESLSFDEMFLDLKSLKVDLLGAYLFKKGEVIIHCDVIAFLALVYKIPLNCLTIIALTHELAHAYTHLGMDIDGIDWDTEAFSNSDLEVIEGMAQFYTHVISEKMESKQPGVNYAFNELLLHQSAPYLLHLKWLKDRKRVGEIMRQTILEFRRIQVGRLIEFEGILYKKHHDFKS